MSYLTIAFPRGKIARPRCECCRETKPEPNKKPVCDTCDEQGCVKDCGSYKRAEACPLRIKNKKINGRVQATAAWNRRARAERKAAGR